MTAALARGMAFLVGLGFALLPAVGPFFALLLLMSTRLAFRRADGVWMAAAFLYSIPAAVSGDAAALARGLAQLVAGWLIYRSFAEIPATRSRLANSAPLGIGLLVGLAAVIGINLLQVESWNFSTAKTVAQAIVWHSSPALFGHTVLALSALIAITTPHRSTRVAALTLGALGILVSGSREAAVAWLPVAIVALATRSRLPWRHRIAEIAVLLGMLAIAAGLGPWLGWGKVGFLLQPAPLEESRNLLTGTEIPTGDWWDASWVSLEAEPIEIGGDRIMGYRVRKVGVEAWLRLQQTVSLQPGRTYTVSTWTRSDSEGVEPGIQGWGQIREDGDVRTLALIGALHPQEGWSATLHGPGTMAAQGVAAVDGAWRRVYATFRYDGDRPLTWFVGLAPDLRPVADTAAWFAGFQVEEGVRSEYVPGGASGGLGLGVARLPYWEAAWNGIRDRPLLGWGADSYPRYFLDVWPSGNQLHVTPAHTHNVYLHTWFERGLVGVAGILLLIAALAWPAAGRGDIPLLVVFAAILFVNVFDTSLLFGGVFYPLVAVAGWRSASWRSTSSERIRTGSQFAVRMALAVADVIAAAVAFAVAAQAVRIVAPGVSDPLSTLPPIALYALLLWPALSWREGLYPGYGATPQQELKKQAAVCSQAALVLGVALVVLGPRLAIPAPVVAIAFVVSLASLPAMRALTKRGLLAFGLWGRPVVILGARGVGARVAAALQRTPLDGLHPLAIFDDDAALAGSRIAGVPVRAPLSAVHDYVRLRAVQHAIVALPATATEDEAAQRIELVAGFRTVQHIPDLGHLPADDAAAVSLDGMLAIEVRNNLALRRNRVAKRVMDLIGVLVGGVLISPVIVALAAAVRLDSRGPVFFGHRRIGRDGRPFTTWKFRTMVEDAERTLQEHLTADPVRMREWEETQKLHDDPRVTRVGRFLRRTSLDELPQLLNVLLGEMSLVGPRPIVTAEIEKYGRAFDLYASVRPGITGQWQVSGRSDTSYRERVELDTYYVRNWSVWLDAIILVRTVRVVVRGSGAY